MLPIQIQLSAAGQKSKYILMVPFLQGGIANMKNAGMSPHSANVQFFEIF
jgi:hypothetical protein